MDEIKKDTESMLEMPKLYESISVSNVEYDPKMSGRFYGDEISKSIISSVSWTTSNQYLSES